MHLVQNEVEEQMLQSRSFFESIPEELAEAVKYCARLSASAQFLRCRIAEGLRGTGQNNFIRPAKRLLTLFDTDSRILPGILSPYQYHDLYFEVFLTIPLLTTCSWSQGYSR